MKKYVWFNVNTGEFSNTWTYGDRYLFDPITQEPEEHKKADIDRAIQQAKESGWKLIEYDCINDAAFFFYNRMKIVTNIKG